MSRSERTNSTINKKIFNGVMTGLISTYAFHPFDKATYMMVKDNLSFLNKKNWKKPYQGVTQSLYGKTIGQGIYFSLYDINREKLGLRPTNAGILTGTIVATSNNFVHVMKMYNWNDKSKAKNAFSLAKEVYTKYGFKMFHYGLGPTIARDALFGGLYCGLGDKYNKDQLYYKDMIFACVATLTTSPINYLRNRLYFDLDQKVNYRDIGKELFSAIGKIPSLSNRLTYLFHWKLNIGIGTLRVGLGMATSKKIYQFFENN